MNSPLPFRLTADQEAVVFSEDANLIVKAAAGSGKTSVLTARYIKHVGADGVSPNQILCVTFTRKAAAEMKRRIVEMLRNKGLAMEAQLAETGPISTLHGFCERLLRENAIDAGLDPDFKILDTSDAGQWLEGAIKEAISTLPESEILAQQFMKRLAGRRDNQGSGNNAVLLDSIRRGVYAFRGTLVTPSSLKQNHADPRMLCEAFRAAYVADMDASTRAFFTQSNENESFWSRVREAYKKSKIPRPKYVPSTKDVAELEADELEAVTLACGLATLVARTWEILEARMAREQSFDFSRLETLTVEMLQSNPPIAEKIRRNYEVLLVDEAQDLNPMQHLLIELLAIATTMSVGDSQQSIYSFRQADVKLFERKVELTKTLDLPTNFRSEPQVLRTVDRFFGVSWPGYRSMLSAEVSPDAQFEGIEVWTQRALDTSQTAEWIAELCEFHDPGDMAVLVKQNLTADILAGKLDALGIPVRIAGGGEKFYTRLEIRDLANALAAITDPTDTFALLAMLRSPIVGISLDAVVLLANETDPFEAIKEFISPIPEDAAKLEKFRNWFFSHQATADRLPAWELLGIIFAESDYLINLATRPGSRRNLANVRKLLSIATSHPEMDGREFAEHMRQIQILKHKEGDALAIDDDERAVTIMTIHKSKGLEFPIVIVPETHSRISSSAKSVEFDKDRGWIGVTYDGLKSPARDYLAGLRKDGERAEALRTLYVAMTRAKRSLCLIASDEAGADTLSNLIWSVLDPKSDAMPGLRIR